MEPIPNTIIRIKTLARQTSFQPQSPTSKLCEFRQLAFELSEPWSFSSEFGGVIPINFRELS